MNGDWFWWGAQSKGNKNRPEDFKTLWRQIHRIFKDAGVRNVLWCWSVSDQYETYGDYYPGDRYVDIIGVDTYFDAPGLTRRTHQVLSGMEARGLGGTKPIFLSELGPNARSDFYNSLPDQLANFPRVKGLMLWMGRKWGGHWPGGGSLIDQSTTPDVMPAFKQFLSHRRSILLGERIPTR